jgi:hypothetical protein
VAFPNNPSVLLVGLPVKATVPTRRGAKLWIFIFFPIGELSVEPFFAPAGAARARLHSVLRKSNKGWVKFWVKV